LERGPRGLGGDGPLPKSTGRTIGRGEKRKKRKKKKKCKYKKGGEGGFVMPSWTLGDK